MCRRRHTKIICKKGIKKAGLYVQKKSRELNISQKGKRKENKEATKPTIQPFRRGLPLNTLSHVGMILR